jgi:hypothetical protein
MKKLKSLLSALLLLISTFAFSQNYIVLKNTSRINIDSILEIIPPVVKYVTLGNQHELEISSILTIRQGNFDITFDADGQPVYTELPKPVVVVKDTAQAVPSDGPGPEEKTPHKVEPPKERRSSTFWEDRPPGVNLLFFPLSLIEPDAGIRLGLSTALTENSTVQADIDFLYRGLEDFGTATNDGIFWGLAGRLEYKNFFDANKNDFHTYVAPQLMVKYKSWTSIDSPSLIFKSTNTILSANLKLGVIVDLGDHFFIDLYTGAGVRYKISSELQAQLPLTITNTQGLPNFLLGVALGIKLGGEN